MTTKDELTAAVAAAKLSLQDAEATLRAFECSAENNVFSSMEDAEGSLEDVLRDRAHEDCEGSYNCGMGEYRQPFIVDGEYFVAVLKCEYNRHDKTYYYLEEASFSVEPYTP